MKENTIRRWKYGIYLIFKPWSDSDSEKYGCACSRCFLSDTKEEECEKIDCDGGYWRFHHKETLVKNPNK